MNRSLVTALLAVSALILPFASVTAAAQSRVEEAPYNWSDLDPVGGAQGEISNVVTFETYPGERFVSASVHDVTGMDVAATVKQDRDGDGNAEVLRRFCSETRRPVRIEGGKDVVVALDLGPCSNTGLPIGISGTVQATFTR